MADPKLVEILRWGSEVWNRWRKQQPMDIQIDLSYIHLQSTNLWGTDLKGADLRGACLNHANLTNADLRHTNLIHANLSHADLTNADLANAYLIDSVLIHADLSYVNLQGTDMRHADMTRVILSQANLRGVDLSRADLSGANLKGAHLSGANLIEARISNTVFARVDLREVKGLAEIDHRGPSIVELHTIQLPQDGGALHFLRGCGVPNEWIDDYRAHMMSPIQYHSCFISYSSKDEVLAQRLHADLQGKGVRCWFAPHDLKIGDKTLPRIDEAIHLQDKLLLLLSEHAIASDWVEHEVETALARERRDKRTILFPIRVDDAILASLHTGWAALVQNERNIGDFTSWKDHDSYQQAFERLLRDLKAETKGGNDG